MRTSLLKKIDELNRAKRIFLIIFIWSLIIFSDFFFILFLNIPSDASLFFLILAAATAIFCFRPWSGLIIGVLNSIINVVVAYISFAFDANKFLIEENYSFLIFSSLVYILFGLGLGYFNESRRRHEAILKESEERYKTLIDRLLVGISIIQDDTIKYANHRFGTILGLSANKIIGSRINELPIVDDKNIIKKLVDDRLRNKIPYIHDYFRARDNENKILDLEFIGSTINHKGRLAIEGAIIDITKRRRAEEKVIEANSKLEEASKMRKTFVSMTAHELRTPLNIISWSLEMLKGEDVGKVNVEQRSILEDLYKTNQRLIVLVNDLLEVSRLDEDRFKINIDKCQIEDVVDEVMGQFSVKIRTKKLKINLKKPKVLFPKIDTDENRLIQVLDNIIGNAVKYTPKGGKIKIEIKGIEKIASEEIIKENNIKQDYKKYILFKVKDSGIGIPKEEQKRMFSRFFRAENASSSNIEGTGLGMFIVKKIVLLLQGMVWFESEEKKGTTVYFTLPIK